MLDVYAEYPASVHKFAAYIGADPKFLVNKAAPELTVYTSFPPTHFVALYGTLKVLGAPFTYLNQQLFSLAIHLMCAILMYYLCRLLTRDKVIAVLGAAMYIFATGTMWYHMNVYWAHQLLMPVFLVALIVFVRRKGLMKWWESAGIGFAMSIIAWTGALAAVGFTAYGIYKFLTTKNRAYLNYLFMLAGMAAAIALAILQVLLTTGASPGEYIDRVLHRVQARSLGSTTLPLAVKAWRVFSGLLIEYGGFILIAYTLALKRKLQGFAWGVLFVSAFPLLESFIIMEHDAVYGFGRLKWIVPVILTICLLGAKYATDKKRRIVLIAAVATACFLHAILYLVTY
ncbi:hypothetical protein [Amycolatopsis sp. lyj-346]|uniref:hypothetical protein n=1 Tax=Amycolatopsis sp. lyj-346 TaxID=2789289 RepID=UPI003979BD32